MKRLLSVVLVLVMVVVLGGFTPEKAALDYYNDMQAAMEGVDSLTGRMIGTVEVAMSGESVEIDMDISYQQIIRSQTDFDFAMRMKLGIMGESIDITAVYKDGYVYATESETGEKIRTAVDMDEMLALIDAMDLDLEVTQDMVIRSTTSLDDRGRMITLILDSQWIKDYLYQYMYYMAGSVSGMKMDVGAISYSAILNDNNLPVRERIKFDMTMEMYGETISCEVDMSHYVSEYNTVEAIHAPADAASYTEY